MSGESSKLPFQYRPEKPDARKRAAKSGFSARSAVFIAVIALIVGQVFGGVTLWMFATFAEGLAFLRIDTWFESTQAQFLFVLLSATFTLLILGLFMRIRKISWQMLGFGRRPRWLDVGYALVAMVIYFAMLLIASSLASTLLGVNIEQEQEIGFKQVVGPSAIALAFISLVVLPPLVEEVLFRGFLFGGLRTKFRFATATFITSIIFAIPHLLASSEGLLWIAGIDTFLLSIVLCYLREQTGSLFAPIVLHALKNGLAFTLLFVIV